MIRAMRDWFAGNGVDVAGLVGLAMIGIGVGLRIGWDVSLIVVGVIVMVAAILIAVGPREEVTQ